jgi:hypothetical protein
MSNVSVNVKLVPATLADCMVFEAVLLQVGPDGKPELSEICWMKTSLFAVTAVVLTV